MSTDEAQESSELHRLNLVSRFQDPLDLDAHHEDWSEPFFFVQGADSQLGLIERYFKHIEPPGWTEELELCEKLVSAVNRMAPKPEFVVVCGDLIDAMPDDPLRPAQVRDFKRLFSKLSADIPLVCVCGNHDIGDEPTMDGLQMYKRDFGADYFFFTVKGVLFIVINSQFYKNRQFVAQYAEQQDRWLELVLAKCKQYKYSIVFQHIPWFLKNPQEEDEYFNISTPVRMEWLRKFKAAGVSKIMCGHYHREAGGWFEDMELVVTSAIGAQFGEQKSGARIVKMKSKTIEHTYYALDELPNTVDL